MDQVVEYFFFFFFWHKKFFRSIHSIGKYNEIYRSLLNCARLNRTDKNLRLINYRISFLVYEKRKKIKRSKQSYLKKNIERINCKFLVARLRHFSIANPNRMYKWKKKHQNRFKVVHFSRSS